MTNHGVYGGKLPKWFLVCADLLLVFILGVIDYLESDPFRGLDFYATAFSAVCSTDFIPGNHRQKVPRKSSFRTCTRVCNSR